MALNISETRQRRLKQRLAGGTPVVAAEVAREFDVSVDTIRRDIIALEAAGLARRVRGGAMPVKAPDAAMDVKIARGDGPADALVAAVLARIGGARTVLMDGGSTTLALAGALPQTPDLLVMTPSPWVAVACNARAIDVYLIGGHLAPGGGVATGAVTGVVTGVGTGAGADTGLGGLAADVAVLGACGLDADFGLSADHDAEARLKRAMAAAAGQVIVPVSAQKLGQRARYRVLGPERIDTIVTNAGAARTGGFSDRGIELIHV